ncbi:MAG: DUF3810 domain-containing protein [Clostridiaceae bacterium]
MENNFEYNKINYKKINRELLINGVILPLLAVTVYLFFANIQSSKLIDEYYTYGISRQLISLISKVTSLAPFSIAEVFFIPAFIISVLIMIITAILRLVNKRGIEAVLIGSKIIKNFSLLLISFYLIWGFNYKAMGVRYLLNLNTYHHDTSDLERLASKLINDAVIQRNGIPSNSKIFKENNQNSKLELNKSVIEISHIWNAAYSNSELSRLSLPEVKFKPVLSSEILSYFGISGIFIPFTAEANVNMNQDPMLIPSAILHEMAHQKGIASEDEANFVAYLVSQSSEDPGIKYSGTMMALIHTMNKLSGEDEAIFKKLYATYSNKMKSDIKFHNEYWKMYEGTTSETVEKINDSYLKANTMGGVSDYQGIVLLLLDYLK